MGDFIRDALAALGAVTLGHMLLDEYQRKLQRQIAEIEQLQREIDADCIDPPDAAASRRPRKRRHRID